MKALLFCKNKAQGLYLQEAFRPQGIHIKIIDEPFSFADYVSFPEKILFFSLPFNEKLTDFLEDISGLRKEVVTVSLFETEPPESPPTDLFFVKPFFYSYIHLRTRQILFEKKSASNFHYLSLGETTLNLFSREICRNSYKIFLRNREFALLQLFMMNPGKILTRTDILEFVWDQFSTISTNTIDVHISRLRNKLRDCSSRLFIRTIPCVGYMLVEP